MLRAPRQTGDVVGGALGDHDRKQEVAGLRPQTGVERSIPRMRHARRARCSGRCPTVLAVSCRSPGSSRLRHSPAPTPASRAVLTRCASPATHRVSRQCPIYSECDSVSTIAHHPAPLPRHSRQSRYRRLVWWIQGPPRRFGAQAVSLAAIINWAHQGGHLNIPSPIISRRNPGAPRQL